MSNYFEYLEGKAAYCEGQSSDSNPYKDDADKFDAWSEGYHDEAMSED